MVIPKVFVKEIICADGAVDTEVDMGFVPDSVQVINQMAATTEVSMWIWCSHMPDLAGYKHLADGSASVYVSSGGDISKLDETAIDPGTENDDADPTRVEAKQGIKIAAAFHDTDDVITVIGLRSDLGD